MGVLKNRFFHPSALLKVDVSKFHFISFLNLFIHCVVNRTITISTPPSPLCEIILFQLFIVIFSDDDDENCECFVCSLSKNKFSFSLTRRYNYISFQFRLCRHTTQIFEINLKIANMYYEENNLSSATWQCLRKAQVTSTTTLECECS